MAKEITLRQKLPKGYGRLDPTSIPFCIPSTKDWHWAAGFYEGEGNAYFHSGTQQVTITQQNMEPLLRMRELFGGRIYSQIGGVRKRPIFAWKINGARARGFLMSIFGLLSEQRQLQARLTLHGEVFQWRRP